MKLIILRGPLASGKLTLATRLGKALGFGVLHNHLTVDVAISVYREFGEGDFFAFTDKLRKAAIEKACENNLDGLIVTICFSTATDMTVVNDWKAIVSSHGGEVIPIYLKVDPKILFDRAESKTRAGTNKIRCKNELKSVIKENHFGPIPFANTASIDTTNLDIESSFKEIESVILVSK